MITELTISNFRSIKKQKIKLGALNVLYGPTASGKSSLLYALMVFNKITTNPNQPIDNFFDLGFIDLGGLKECLYGKDEELAMEISYSTNSGEFGISLKKDKASTYLKYKNIKLTAEFSIPYKQTKIFETKVDFKTLKGKAYWNGFYVLDLSGSVKEEGQTGNLISKLNEIANTIKQVDIAPHNRGFFEAFYSHYLRYEVPHVLISDEEVASAIINQEDLVPKISKALEEIANKSFRIHPIQGIPLSRFLIQEKGSNQEILITNEGFGINQVVYMLTKLYLKDKKIILIEEPEIHLHPSIIRKLAKIMCKIVEEENKQIILTTHSEVFVSSLLSAIRRKDISHKKVKFYLVEKEKGETIFKEQECDDKGRIKGGLSSFMEGELEDLKAFFEI